MTTQDCTKAGRTIHNNRAALGRFITYLKISTGIQDVLSIFVAKTEGLGLGDVRQMIDQKVGRVHQVTVNTNAEIDRITEVAEDIVWLIKWVDTFLLDEDVWRLFPQSQLILERAELKDALLERRNDLLAD